MLFQCFRDHRPGLFQIELAIFGEEGGEGRLVGKGAAGIVARFKFVDLSSPSAVGEHVTQHAPTFHLSISSVSHGLSRLWVEGMMCRGRRGSRLSAVKFSPRRALEVRMVENKRGSGGRLHLKWEAVPVRASYGSPRHPRKLDPPRISRARGLLQADWGGRPAVPPGGGEDSGASGLNGFCSDAVSFKGPSQRH